MATRSAARLNVVIRETSSTPAFCRSKCRVQALSFPLLHDNATRDNATRDNATRREVVTVMRGDAVSLFLDFQLRPVLFDKRFDLVGQSKQLLPLFLIQSYRKAAKPINGNGAFFAYLHRHRGVPSLFQ